MSDPPEIASATDANQHPESLLCFPTFLGKFVEDFKQSSELRALVFPDLDHLCTKPEIDQIEELLLESISEDIRPILSVALPSSRDSINSLDTQLLVEALKIDPVEITRRAFDIYVDYKDQLDDNISGHDESSSTVGDVPDRIARDPNQSSPNSDSPPNLSRTVNEDEILEEFIILDTPILLEAHLNQFQSEGLELDANQILITLPLQEILAEGGQSLINVLPEETESSTDTQQVSGDRLTATADETTTPKVTRTSRFLRRSANSTISLQFDRSSAKDVLEKMLKAIVNFMKPKNEKLLDKIHLKDKSHINHIVNVLLTIDGLYLIRALNTIDLIASFSYVRFLDSIHKSSGTGWKDLPMVQKFEKFINTEYTSLGIERRVSRRDLMRILGSLGTREGYFLVCALSFEFKTPEQTALVEVFVEICSMVPQHALNQAIPAQIQQNASTPEKEVVAKVFGSQIGSSILKFLKSRYYHGDVLLLRTVLMDGNLKVKKRMLANFLESQEFPKKKFIRDNDIPMTVQVLVSHFGRGLIREICVPKDTDLKTLEPKSLVLKATSGESDWLLFHAYLKESPESRQKKYQGVSLISRAGLNRKKEEISDLNHTNKDRFLKRIILRFTEKDGSSFSSEDSTKVQNHISETLGNISSEIDNAIEKFHLCLSKFMTLLSEAYKDHKIELPDRLDHAEIKESAFQCVNSFEYHVANFENLPPQIDSSCNAIKEILSSLNMFYSFIKLALGDYLRDGQECVRLMAGGILFVEQRRTMMGVFIEGVVNLVQLPIEVGAAVQDPSKVTDVLPRGLKIMKNIHDILKIIQELRSSNEELVDKWRAIERFITAWPGDYFDSKPPKVLMRSKKRSDQ
ncbi:hypothetical protein PUMCH_001776 [Australozyma saopauloensis]|uniref:Uncharacterized protein n=1 Tax=Australozyma saopauloensis TaxID=291208 RepID=A0AAX4H7P8_9ASCO|nr:hypothetical protein PUMCH_001776 [[Candida] saopauloensis]